MEVEIPQPISSLPTRFGSFTTGQLWWTACALLPVYLCLRLHPPLPLGICVSAPWLTLGLLLAFARREGRALDAFLADWLLFQVQPKLLQHPEAMPERGAPLFLAVDGAARRSGALPWSPP